METTVTLAPAALYQLAEAAAIEAAKNFGDNGYGCGSSFVTIKWGTEFMKWAKKEGLVKKDGYYGWVLNTNDNAHTSATLTEEEYNTAFAKVLSSNGVHAFNHTYLS